MAIYVDDFKQRLYLELLDRLRSRVLYFSKTQGKPNWVRVEDTSVRVILCLPSNSIASYSCSSVCNRSRSRPVSGSGGSGPGQAL